jgi:DHA2 family multidrug resistance protein
VGEKVRYVETPMTASLLRTSGSHTDAQMKAMGQIYQSLQQQASILSYIEVLQTLAIFCACMVPLVLLMKRPPKGTTAAVH